METFILHPEQEPLDKKWYKEFEQVGSFQAYEYLDGNKEYREVQKQAFLNGEINNPNLDYPKIDPEQLKAHEQKLLTLKEKLKEEQDETIRQLYVWKINEKLVEVRMLQMTHEGNSRLFKRYSSFVYGIPDKNIFVYTINNIRKNIEKNLSSEDESIKLATQEVEILLSNNTNIDTTQGINTLPELETIQIAKIQTEKDLNNILDITDEKNQEYTAKEIEQMFASVLKNLEAEGWNVIITKSSKTGISVDQENKTINIPESRKVSFKKLKTLIAHEIGTHVIRRLNGERSKLLLLGLGLDRYEKAEEGVATMREQALDEKVEDFAGLDGHLAIGLAYGLDGKPRDFREVYTILEKYFYYKNITSGKKADEASQQAQTSAWNRTVRTFRGTDCKTPGACFTKDIIYREGNIETWNLISKDVKSMITFNLGKFDPVNNRHIEALMKLGILDENLKELGIKS
ncbi:MAG: tyrosine/phenylalanine carboxypeptidase domain-containing protein [Candidatus Magasanikbacteria bacterium]